MVWALEEFLHIGVLMHRNRNTFHFAEDQQVLSGHVATLLGNFDQADQLFSASSQPKHALEVGHCAARKRTDCCRCAGMYSIGSVPWSWHAKLTPKSCHSLQRRHAENVLPFILWFYSTPFNWNLWANMNKRCTFTKRHWCRVRVGKHQLVKSWRSTTGSANPGMLFVHFLAQLILQTGQDGFAHGRFEEVVLLLPCCSSFPCLCTGVSTLP